MTFRDQEKLHYQAVNPKLFTEAAQTGGSYRGEPRHFCLSDKRSA